MADPGLAPHQRDRGTSPRHAGRSGAIPASRVRTARRPAPGPQLPSATWALAPPARATPLWQRVLPIGVVGVVAALILVLLVGATALAYYARQLPNPQDLASRHQFDTARILDRNGELLHEIQHPLKGKRTAVPLRQIPQHLRQAVLAAEDAGFYAHGGLDVRAIVRAAGRNFRARRVVEGGSTITQQLVKVSLLSDEISVRRKAQEAVLALLVDARYSKDQILEMYLNNVYFGQQAYGAAAAAATYFGKQVDQLSLAESALLAGLIRSPSSTNPFANHDAARAAQGRVLEALVRHRFIDAAAAQAAREQPLDLRVEQQSSPKAPHFSMWIRDLVKQNPKLGEAALYERGLRITTTLDLRMQEMAELIVREHAARLTAVSARDAALVALNPATGEILAMVGSADFSNKDIQGEVNVALAPRQPGSAIKPVTYLAALLKGWTAATVIDDAPVEFPVPGRPPYRPRNYDGRFHGKVSVRMALANSYNVAAVKTLHFVGLRDMLELARRLGITTFQDPSRYGLSLTLGGGEVKLLDLSSAYGTIANGGRRLPPVAVHKIVDGRGRALFEAPAARPQQVVSAPYAYLITSILSDNEARTPAFGANSPLKLSRPAAVKTGTTDDFRDNWTIGYTGQLVAGVWVGNADNRAMRGATGVTGAAPIWRDFMEFALRPLPVDELAPPVGLERLPVAFSSGQRWQDGCPEEKFEEWFVRGTAPKEICRTPPAPSPAPTATPAPAQIASPTARGTSTARGQAEVGVAGAVDVSPRDVARPTATAIAQMMRERASAGDTAQPTTTSAAPAPAPAAVMISSPAQGTTVSGAVPVRGSASLPGFQYYTLAFRPLSGSSSGQWSAIGGRHTQPVIDGPLGVWPTSGLRAGPYALRLTVVSSSDRRELSVQLNVT